ncbi:hypothetical protein SLS54_004930 [Diplodia seriata]
MSVTQALTTDSSNARREPSSSSSGAAPERTRLHITPFTPDLLKAFIPPSVLPQASRISYHAVQTFPDKGFGYVELPTMEAQKLKKKFTGSILKGQKVRIEDARPEKRKKILEEAQAAAEAGLDEEDRKAGKKVKKVKRKDNVLPGYELPDERHVKRGWTEPESKKDHKRKDKTKKDKKHKSQPSKYTTDKELLFKTKLPPNAVPTAKTDKSLEKPKKSKTSSRDVVVHEFSKTTKHASFLKSSQVSKDGKTAAEFVEGKGWVDESGNVVEQESESQRRRREAKAEAKRKRTEEKAAAAATAAAAAAAEEEGKKSKRKSALELAEALEAKRKATKATKATKAAEPSDESSEIEEEDVSDDRSSVVSTSSSDVSSSSDEESEESLGSEAESEVAQEDEAEAEESSSESEPQVAHTKAADQDSIPHGNSGGDVEMADSAEKAGDAEKEAKEVHPLEALFKPRNPPEGGTPTKLAPINTTFSFFGGGDDEEEEAVEEANVPLTPYTRRDLQIRGMRSAAPTPDTAAIDKRFWRNAGDDEDEDEDEEVEDSMMQVDANSVPIGSRGPEITIAPAQSTEEADQSEFAKHFWEHRGDYNRAWKKRRREAMKVQRQRENRRLGRKVV